MGAKTNNSSHPPFCVLCNQEIDLVLYSDDLYLRLCLHCRIGKILFNPKKLSSKHFKSIDAFRTACDQYIHCSQLHGYSLLRNLKDNPEVNVESLIALASIEHLNGYPDRKHKHLRLAKSCCNTSSELILRSAISLYFMQLYGKSKQLFNRFIRITRCLPTSNENYALIHTAKCYLAEMNKPKSIDLELPISDINGGNSGPSGYPTN